MSYRVTHTTTYVYSEPVTLCHNLVQEIEAKTAQLVTERVWADPLPDIRVGYKNITKVYFRVVKADYVDRLKRARWRPEFLDQFDIIE